MIAFFRSVIPYVLSIFVIFVFSLCAGAPFLIKLTQTAEQTSRSEQQ